MMERKWRVQKQVSQLTNTKAGDKCQSIGKLFLSNVHFVYGKALCLVDSDSPC